MQNYVGQPYGSGKLSVRVYGINDIVGMYCGNDTSISLRSGVWMKGMITTSTSPQTHTAPRHYLLRQNFPNPFNPSTTISYDLPKQEEVSLIIYDSKGREINTLLSREQAAGHYELQWNGVDRIGGQLSSGVYFARLTAGDYSKTIKMVYLK